MAYKFVREDEEIEALLPALAVGPEKDARIHRPYSSLHLGGAFVLGLLAAIAHPVAYAPPWAGLSIVEPFPPASPTNAYPELFPTDVGHAGPTPTGAEPALVATAPVLPMYTQAPHLVAPAETKDGKDASDGWDLFRKWGNLSPWYSVPRGAFGIDAGAEAPEGCSVTGLHLLHRHGARYPTGGASYGAPGGFAARLNDAAVKWTGAGELSFLNQWTYKLGEEILTPFGRQQLYDLGVSIRMKYGFLLNNFTRTNTLPVFRTESQDRMFASAQNFAAGFFGIPYATQYQQLVTIEAVGFNNTLAPSKTCPNSKDPAKGDRGAWYVARWADVYLAGARARLAKQLPGFDLRVEDVYSMQQTCAYETVALGYSKFCGLFTREEWEGFDHALDLYFWYGAGFGSPVARVKGVGYVQELVARLTHTPIATHNSSTNATLADDPRTFPLDHALYVDATHEVVVLHVLTALNLTTLAAGGPPRADRMPEQRSFSVSQLAPFATNVQFQLLNCPARREPAQIRVIVNDGAVPLTGIAGCGADKLGLCALSAFVEGQKRMIRETDWVWGCHGNWTVPAGDEWETMAGYPPVPPQ